MYVKTFVLLFIVSPDSLGLFSSYISFTVIIDCLILLMSCAYAANCEDLLVSIFIRLITIFLRTHSRLMLKILGPVHHSVLHPVMNLSSDSDFSHTPGNSKI